jgi:hypothetical protein
MDNTIKVNGQYKINFLFKKISAIISFFSMSLLKNHKKEGSFRQRN